MNLGIILVILSSIGILGSKHGCGFVEPCLFKNKTTVYFFENVAKRF